MMRISGRTSQLTLNQRADAVATRTITPKERLNPVDRNALLSSILKFLFPGNRRMMRSTHIIDAILISFQTSRGLEKAMVGMLPPNVHAV